MNNEIILGNIISGAVGGLVVALITHFLTKERDKQTSERAAMGAKQARKREFMDLVAEIRGTIGMSDDPSVWVNYFTDTAAPALHAGFDKISGDLSETDRVMLDDAVLNVLAFARMNGAEIYANKAALYDALGKVTSL